MNFERLTIDRISDKGCANVLCALIKRMGMDFMDAYQRCLRNPEDEKNRAQYEQLRNDFKSDYFRHMTGFNGEQIMKSLKYYARRDLRAANAAALQSA